MEKKEPDVAAMKRAKAAFLNHGGGVSLKNNVCRGEKGGDPSDPPEAAPPQ